MVFIAQFTIIKTRNSGHTHQAQLLYVAKKNQTSATFKFNQDGPRREGGTTHEGSAASCVAAGPSRLPTPHAPPHHTRAADRDVYDRAGAIPTRPATAATATSSVAGATGSDRPPELQVARATMVALVGRPALARTVIGRGG